MSCVIKHKFRIETGNIRIFGTIYFYIKHSETKEKERVRQESKSETGESNVQECKHVKKC